MSLFDCIQRWHDYASKEDPAEAAKLLDRARRAQDEWKNRSDRYEASGHPRHVAEVLAADDVKEAFRREAGQKRHAYLSTMAFQRKAQAHVNEAAKPDMINRHEQMDYKHRGLVRRFNGRLGAYLKKNHRTITGKMTNPAQQAKIADELHGISTGDAQARALVDGIRDALEDMRLMFNEAGGFVSKMDNWGLPHIHDRLALMRSGFKGWFNEIDGRLDWARINDPLTGKPIQADPRTGEVPLEFRERYLKEAYDNIVFSKDADNPVYGRPKGVATYRKHADSRHLHFKSGKDWMDYNSGFGTGGIHQSLIGHVHRMARDITLMREFGPNPKLGAEYEADLWRAKARKTGDQDMLRAAEKDSSVALRMMNVMSGGGVPEDASQQWIARFFSNTRGLLTSAFLDRAIVASMSDLNSMRMAAKTIGMNPSNLLSKQVGALQSLNSDELLRAGWVAATQADAGTAVARFQQEFASSEWVERVTQASMRLQGLSAWTDRARATFYQEFGGFMAAQIDRPLSNTSSALQMLFKKWGVSEAEWDIFRRPETLFRADNGATFALPTYWRQVTDLPSDKADDLFFKVQGAIEEIMELAVPTQSLLARAFVDPAAYNLPPGTIAYEFMKSATMFKSFTMSFTVNQYRQIMARPTLGDRVMYGLDLAAGATVLGAVAIQANELMMGRDPQDMTNPSFMARAAMKGGGFGIIGDIVTTGQASWGGGFSGYIAGPVPQAMTDVWGLTIGNAMTAAYQLAKGEEVDTNFAVELGRFGKRYTPMGQTPIVGPAIDRLFWDRLSIMLDPEAANSLAKAAKRTGNLNGNDSFWLPGQATPSRGPDLGNALGR
jgi:hypothetical protein